MSTLKIVRIVEAADLDDIATGGAILGTGGGGDPYIGKLMAKEAIRRHGPVTMVSVEGFDDDALIAPVCMMGAPTVMTEKLPQGDEIVIALRKLEKIHGPQGRRPAVRRGRRHQFDDAVRRRGGDGSAAD